MAGPAPVVPWGSDGNRYNRNMMSRAYLDGQQASIVITRGGNSRNEVHAYDFRNGQLTLRWTWAVPNGGGNYGHNVRAADIDGDGKDEFLFFNVAIDDDGQSVLWNTQERHGDRFHLTDIDPDRPGLEVFYVQEFSDSYQHPISLRDARTGELIWGPEGNWGDVGRGLCANIDPDHRGAAPAYPRRDVISVRRSRGWRFALLTALLAGLPAGSEHLFDGRRAR